MAVKVYHDSEIDSSPLEGNAIAVLGYGNQGRAHALNLRDSGHGVVVGQRQGGSGHAQAERDGFKPVTLAQATAEARLIIIALPDEVAPGVYSDAIAPNLEPGQTLGFIHGFNIHYGQIVPPENLDVILVAPKGAGYMVRNEYVDGHGLPCLVAVHQDASGAALPMALAWAKGIGCARAGVVAATFAAETETDLFGEQVSVVGGVTALMKAAYETLVEAGYEPEHAYFECVHEVKFVVDLIHRHGLDGMRRHISATAAFGGMTRGPMLGEAVRPVMRRILQEIRDGTFATEWIAESRAGGGRFQALLDQDKGSDLERTGERLRKLAQRKHK